MTLLRCLYEDPESMRYRQRAMWSEIFRIESNDDLIVDSRFSAHVGADLMNSFRSQEAGTSHDLICRKLSIHIHFLNKSSSIHKQNKCDWGKEKTVFKWPIQRAWEIKWRVWYRGVSWISRGGGAPCAQWSWIGCCSPRCFGCPRVPFLRRWDVALREG